MRAFFRRLSINQKLTLITVMASSVALLVACFGFVAYDRITFKERMADHLSVLAETMGINTTAALNFDVPESAAEVLRGLKAEPHIQEAWLFRNDGQPFAHYSRGDSTAKTAPSLPSPGVYWTADTLL